MEADQIELLVKHNQAKLEDFLSYLDPNGYAFLDFRFGLTGTAHSLEETAEEFKISLEGVQRRERHLLRALISRLSQPNPR
jgi:DNA-directed RNA polymerase sigma subunit (sigma70/sigma32)